MEPLEPTAKSVRPPMESPEIPVVVPEGPAVPTMTITSAIGILASTLSPPRVPPGAPIPVQATPAVIGLRLALCKDCDFSTHRDLEPEFRRCTRSNLILGKIVLWGPNKCPIGKW